MPFEVETMQTRITKTEPCLREVEVTVDAEAIQSTLTRSLNEVRAQVALPGFRPGKVPMDVVKRKFGEQVRHDVLHDLMREGIEAGVREHTLEMVSEPELVDQEEGSAHHHLPESGPFVFSFRVEVKAAFELPEYKGIAVTRKLEPVGDAAVDEVVQNLRERASRFEPIEGGAYEPGDLLLGTLTLKAGSAQVCENLDVQAIAEYPVVARGVRLVDAQTAFKDAVAGATLSVSAEITPHHETKELHGKTATGELTVTALRRKKLPEISDELAKEMGKDSMAELRADISRRLEVDAKLKADRKVVTDILDTLLTRVEIPVAKGPLERMVARRARDLAQRLSETGAPAEAIMKKAREEAEATRGDLEKDTKKWLLVEKIAKKEKIFCLEDDLDAAFQDLARQHDVTPTKVREHYEQEGLVAELRAEIVERKCCEFLSANAQIADG
jgi:trigger factor